MRVQDVDGEVGVGRVQLGDEFGMLRSVDGVPKRTGTGGYGVDVFGCGLPGKGMRVSG